MEVCQCQAATYKDGDSKPLPFVSDAIDTDTGAEFKSIDFKFKYEGRPWVDNGMLAGTNKEGSVLGHKPD